MVTFNKLSRFLVVTASAVFFSGCFLFQEGFSEEDAIYLWRWEENRMPEEVINLSDNGVYYAVSNGFMNIDDNIKFDSYNGVSSGRGDGIYAVSNDTVTTVLYYDKRYIYRYKAIDRDTLVRIDSNYIKTPEIRYIHFDFGKKVHYSNYARRFTWLWESPEEQAKYESHTNNH